MKKKILSALLLIILSTFVIASISVSAEKSGIYEYTVSDGKATITDCDTSVSGEIIIPDMLGGFPVTSIDEYAFYNYDSLTSIIIPDSVTSIGMGAFYGCKSLTNITIPNGVKNIEILAFTNCDSLTSITIPDSVESFSSAAFEYCRSLTSINVSENNPWYCSENGVVFNKEKTTLILYPIGKTDISYTIPNNITNISYSAFSDCDNLTSITIPDSVTSIGFGVFAGCDNLTSITIPDSVTRIGDSVFSGCESLTDVYYSATENEWNSIEIGKANESLFNANIHFSSSGNKEIKVTLYGEKIEFDQPPVIENGRTLVPLRAIFEALNAEVLWEGETQTVRSVKNDTSIELKIGSNEMKVNNEVKYLDVPAKIINDRTMVPARAVAEAFGCTVDWDAENSTVVIN